MECLQNVPLARVYHSPKDDLVHEVALPLYPAATIVRRSTGDIRSTALVLLREGIASFLEANGGGGKILWLSSDKVANGDIDAVRNMDAYAFHDIIHTLREGPPLGQEGGWGRRVLATLLSSGVLEWKIVRMSGGGMYHEKGLIIEDSCGHRLFLAGTWNETLQGYTRNVERVDVHREADEEERCREALHWFEDLWSGTVEGLDVLDIKEAVRTGAIQPQEDEPFRPFIRGNPRPELWTPELLYLSIQDKLPSGLRDPYAGTLVDPQPHQAHVHQRVLSRPPIRFLLADEVGLGKTIEAGLILSSLVGAGMARRIIILGPKNVLHQWRDELWEKFQLQSWMLEGNRWTNEIMDESVEAERPLFRQLPGHPPYILLVSRALAMRRERFKEFSGSKWDVVVLDEAHRATSRLEEGFYRKNNLLKVLTALSGRSTSILLLTATPVQLGLGDLHDLLSPLGIPDGWRPREAFERFIQDLDKDDPDWRWLFEMALESERYYKNVHGLIQQVFDDDLSSGIEWYEGLPASQEPRRAFTKLLDMVRTKANYNVVSCSQEERELLRVLLYRMSPLYQLVCRNTRNLLRRYRDRHLMDVQIPDRVVVDPQDVEFTPAEATLYDDLLEGYIRKFYKRYGEAGFPAHAVGFVLAIYAKRASSSWAALELSLARRKAKLEEALKNWDRGGPALLFGGQALRSLLSEGEEEEESDLTAEGYEEILEIPQKARPELNLEKGLLIVNDENLKVAELLQQVKNLTNSRTDTKNAQLHSTLRDILNRRRGVIVFSQFKDTVDYLADSYIGSEPQWESVAKYHGEGGEFWDGTKWISVKKGAVETAVAKGKVRVLFATDAASEGLNLQGLDTVLNYDLPWNPMRIEQRIGRVDRLKQTSPIVELHTILPRHTIEQKVYARAFRRTILFERALGSLQPLLLENYIRRALLSGEDIDDELDETILKWETASKSSTLFERALASLTPGQQWKERRKVEAEALEGLLQRLGFLQEGDIWMRGNERVAIHRFPQGTAGLVAAPENPFFNSLLAELGPRPQEIKRGMATFKTVNCGDRVVMVVEPNQGEGYFLIEDLTRMDGRGQTQIGTNLEQVRQYVLTREDKNSEAFRNFRIEQDAIRRNEWRHEVERLFRELLRYTQGDKEKVARLVIERPMLASIWETYIGSEDEPSINQVVETLSTIGEGGKKKGKRSNLVGILKRAKDLSPL